MIPLLARFGFFFFNDTATTEIYTLSLHDALPIYRPDAAGGDRRRSAARRPYPPGEKPAALSRPLARQARSEEHTSELQSLAYLVCRLLLEKKKASSPATGHPIASLHNSHPRYATS